MRKLFLLTLSLVAICVQARQISPDEAASIAATFLNVDNSPQKKSAVRMAKPKATQNQSDAVQEAEPYYIFNAPEDKGFVIVSGDDRAKKILGYSDKGNFDFDNMPPQLQWMLSQYEEEIIGLSSSISDLELENNEKGEDRQPIAPLVKSQWGQGGVYNYNCPIVEGERTPAGCVPVAVAQIMYYHQWPENGEQTYTYQHHDGRTFSYDFQNTSFNWNLIQDRYDDKASDDSKAEIAKLLQAVGYALNTQYSFSIGSSSNIAYAKRGLVENLKYDTNARIVWRNNYRLKEWEDLIHSELLAGRPVYVEGAEPNGVGHAFVCDGYSSRGLFHFNWGWGGDFDGFFAFSALAPNVNNFCKDITALINIHRRDGEPKELTYDIVMKGGIEYIPQTNEITFSGVTNYTSKLFEGWEGCEYVNNETQESFFFPGNTCMIEKVEFWGIYSAISGSTPSFFAIKNPGGINWSSPYGDFYIEFNITPGSYTIYPAINSTRTLNSDKWQRLNCISGGQSHLDLIVDEDYNFQYSNPGLEVSPNIEITDIWINRDGKEKVNWVWAHEDQFQLCFKYVNHSDFPVNKITYRIYDENGNYVGENYYPTTIEPNCEGGFSFLNNVIDFKPGKYEIRAFDITGMQINNTPYWFEAKKREYNLEVTDIEVVGYDNYWYIDYVQFEGVIHNKSDESNSPFLRYEFKNGIGETYTGIGACTCEPNSTKKLQIQKERGFLIGECTLKIFEPYGNQINETFSYQFPWPKVNWIGFDIQGGSIRIGDSLQLKAIVFPEYAANKSIIWSSSNETVATVDDDGNVTAVGVGTAIITATAADGSGVSASCQVEVYMPDKGDSNANGVVNIADAVNTANYAVGMEVEKFCFEAADVNEDNRITLSDASGTVTIILDQPVEATMASAFKKPAISGHMNSDCLIIGNSKSMDGKTVIPVTLDNTVDYVALQGEVILPEGMEFIAVNSGERTLGSHSLMTKRIDSRTIRIALFDMNNRAFRNGDEALFELIVRGNNSNSGNIEIRNIVASDASANEYILNSVGGFIPGTSGIDDIQEGEVQIETADGEIRILNACGREIAIYSVDGRTVSRFIAVSDRECRNVEAGMYIIAVGDKVSSVIVK